MTFTKTFTFSSDSYSFDLAVKLANHTSQPLEGQLSLELSENYADEDATRFHFLGFNGSINQNWDDIKSGGLKEPKTFTGKVDWAGLDEGYFLTAMVPAAPKAVVHPAGKAAGPHGDRGEDPGGEPGAGPGDPGFLRPLFRPQGPGRPQAPGAGPGGELRLVRFPGQAPAARS